MPDDYYLTRTALLNRCNCSPWAIASQTFQDDPQPLEIAWVRQEHAGLFHLLDRLADPAERALAFHRYALDHPWLHEDPERRPDERERLRRSYVQVLRGWGVDSNGASGAVLKGWAESRFGLRTVWHQEGLDAADAEDGRFASERMRGATAGIGGQLDLLYTYCQDELIRRMPGQRWIDLYRGTHDPEAYTVRSGGTGGDLVEFNAVSSFSADPEVAWEFGSRVWRVRVPLAKVVSFSGLVPPGLLQGEQEYIVLGGDYLACPLRC